MTRRSFAAGLAASYAGLPAQAQGDRELSLDGTHLRLWHLDQRLHAAFTAPTEGWLAVGFNNAQTLKGTRFVIGVVGAEGTHAEEHIAQVPHHPTVQALGLQPAVEDVAGEAGQGSSTLRFSLPHRFPDTATPDLTPGTVTHLMLAWSHHRDFHHHSAWRRHQALGL